MSLPSQAMIISVKFWVEESLVIADPCYIDENDGPGFVSLRGPDTGGLIVPDVAGIWIGSIVLDDAAGIGGQGVSILRLQNKDDPYSNTYSWERLGIAGVDSGQMYAGCFSNLPLDYDALLLAYQTGKPNTLGEPTWVNHNCLAFGGGIVSSTGYGDGAYGVYANHNRSLIEVRFMEDLEEDEY